MQNKKLLAIVVTVLGGFTTLIALLAVISSFAGGLYEDVHVFELDLKAASKPLRTSGFRRIDKVDLSLWLKVPDRKIENKPIDIDSHKFKKRAVLQVGGICFPRGFCRFFSLSDQGELGTAL